MFSPARASPGHPSMAGTRLQRKKRLTFLELSPSMTWLVRGLDGWGMQGRKRQRTSAWGEPVVRRLLVKYGRCLGGKDSRSNRLGVCEESSRW
jgi:hypothetical protein